MRNRLGLDSQKDIAINLGLVVIFGSDFALAFNPQAKFSLAVAICVAAWAVVGMRLKTLRPMTEAI